MDSNYSVVIQWSEEGNCFVARLPEWGNYHVEGESYEAVLANAQQAIALLTKSFATQGKTLPQATTFQMPSVTQ